MSSYEYAEMVRLLLASGKTVATAESCTGGYLSFLMTQTPGASRWFRGGVVVYQTELKEHLLGVSHSTLAEYDVVSRQVAEEMAKQARTKLGADFGLATTGFAGPEGGNDTYRVGSVCMAITDGQDTHHVLFVGDQDRQSIMQNASKMLLEAFTEYLKKQS